MGTLELNFKVTVKDFREAIYYTLFMQKRNFFRVAVVVIAACFIYVVLIKKDRLISLLYKVSLPRRSAHISHGSPVVFHFRQ